VKIICTLFVFVLDFNFKLSQVILILYQPTLFACLHLTIYINAINKQVIMPNMFNES